MVRLNVAEEPGERADAALRSFLSAMYAEVSEFEFSAERFARGYAELEAAVYETGTLTAVIVPGMVTAFGVFWMTQYLEEALPYELVEAARVDGCSMIRTFWHVALPAARPAAAMLALFTFVGSWTSFFWPFIVLGSGNPTLPVALQLLQASYFKDYSLIMAGVVVSTIPLVLVFIVAGRQLVTGIMQGAVKG